MTADTLEALTAAEEELAREVSRATGLIEEKYDQLDAAGVFGRYRDVHAGYARLAAAGDLEALKRALFLQWYALSEPSCFTGIHETDPAAAQAVLELLERLLARGGLDDELSRMLPYYYFHTDFFIEARPGLESLKRYCRRNLPELPSSDWIDRRAMADRGLMGEYWRSLGPAGRSGDG